MRFDAIIPWISEHRLAPFTGYECVFVFVFVVYIVESLFVIETSAPPRLYLKAETAGISLVFMHK